MEEQVNVNYTAIKYKVLTESTIINEKIIEYIIHRNRVLVLNCYGSLSFYCWMAWKLFVDLAFLIDKRKRPK